MSIGSRAAFCRLREQPVVHKRRCKSKGFTLIESLVALAIAAGVLSAFYQASASALQLRQKGEEAAQAALLVHLLVARLGTTTRLVPGLEEGRENGFTWSVMVAQAGEITLTDSNERILSPGVENLLIVRVTVSNEGETQPLKTLQTYRLDPAVRQ
jgi:prepilin-type N-terminal cleavage/methylation domain-containing protein